MTFLRLTLRLGNQGETIHQRARHHGGALHTDDVPSNYLALLSSLWTLRKVDYAETRRGSFPSFEKVA